MDEMVARSMARWPNVPAVYGWLSLDRRGTWRIKQERVGNAALREFIARNYHADERGCWFFQNGPQRVFVRLDYTPLVVHYEATRCSTTAGARSRAARCTRTKRVRSCWPERAALPCWTTATWRA